MRWFLVVPIVVSGLVAQKATAQSRGSYMTESMFSQQRVTDEAGTSLLVRMDAARRTHLTAQTSVLGFPTPPAEYKDPGTATLLSVLCPGCGQLWAGDTHRGALLLAIGWGAPLVGITISSGTCGSGTCGLAPMTLGLLAWLGAWGYGIYDAGPTARRMNALHGVAPSVSIGPAPNSLSLGLRLTEF